MSKISILVLLSIAGAASAQPAKQSATACVNREATEWRQVRDPILDDTSLQYCTGDDCWSLDLATNTVRAAPKRPKVKKLRDAPGILTDGKGTTLASADENHVSFCSGGDPSSCKSFDFKIANHAVNGIAPDMNDEHTLGALTYLGESENGSPSYVLAFDLVKSKQVGKRKAGSIEVLGHGFLVDGTTLYNAAFKKVGRLAAPDQAWERLGKSDLVALHDKKTGEFVFQDTRTGLVKTRVAHGVADKSTLFQFVPTPDGTKLYAIGFRSDEGEVLTIDVATGKITNRSTPTPCAPGTHRVN